MEKKDRTILLLSPFPLFSLIFFFLFPASEGMSAEVEMSGFIEMDKRFDISDGLSNGDTYGKLRLEAKSDLTPDLFTLVSLDLRYYDLPALEDLPSVSKLESDYAVDPLLWEAYAEVNQLVRGDLDMKIGKQRIAWGTADRFNPTDNLNPDDFTDFLDFGSKVPTPAVKGDYYLGDYTITAVWLPLFEPALFSRGGTASLLGAVPDNVKEPARTLENGMYALKLSGVAFNLDYSLSYFSGFDDIPVALDSSVTPEMGFPEMEVLGLDFAGEFRSVGFWGEAALFLPDEIRSGPDVIQSSESYVKYTLGLDYTFGNGIYLEAQFVHGFFTERGSENLHDYLIASIEKRFLNDELKLSLGGALEVKDMENVNDDYGTGLFPGVTYYPVDNLELTAGAFLLGGERGTLFGSWKDLDQVYFKVKASF